MKIFFDSHAQLERHVEAGQDGVAVASTLDRLASTSTH